MRKMGEIKNPRTNLEDLVEFYKEIKAMENLAFARLKAEIFTEKAALSYLKGQMQFIKTRYHRTISYDDCYDFPSLHEMKSFLKSTGYFSNHDIKDAIKHEESHFNAASKEGFRVDGFRCWLAKCNKKISYVCATRIAVTGMPAHDTYKKISNSPHQPSFIDKFAL